MNIEHKLRLVRQARKRRLALPYHRYSKTGIDVETDNYTCALNFLKQLFKVAKSHNYDVQMSFWGEVYLVEQERPVYVAISINHALPPHATQSLLNQLKDTAFALCSMGIEYPTAPIVSFQAQRPGTKPHIYNFEELGDSPVRQAKALFEFILTNTGNLQRTVRRNAKVQIDEVEIEDVMALVRYGAAKLGKHSCLHNLARDEVGMFPNRCIIGQDQTIQLFSSFINSYPYLLKPAELKVIRLLLPQAGLTHLEFER